MTSVKIGYFDDGSENNLVTRFAAVSSAGGDAAVAALGGGRAVTTFTPYLAHNARANLLDFYDSSVSTYFDSAVTSWLADTRVKYLPARAGGYAIQGAVSLTADNLALVGDGPTASYFIQQTADAHGLVAAPAGGVLSGLMLQGIGVRMKASTKGGTAFDLSAVADSDFYSLFAFCDSSTDGFVTGVKLYGATVSTGSVRNNFFGCRARTYPGATSIGVQMDGAAATYGANSTHWYGGYVRADSGTGVLITNSDQVLLSGIEFEGSTNQAVKITGDGSTSTGHVVTSCRFEGVTNGVLLDTGSVGNLVMGNFYTSGLSSFVTDNGSRNFVIEPTVAGGNAIALSRGDFTTLSGKFSANPSVANIGNDVLVSQAQGETQPRLRIKGNGPISIGSGGSTAPDVTLTRPSSASMGMSLGKWVEIQTTAADGATSPDVKNCNVLAFANTSATTVTAFSNSQDGQYLICKLDANTTIQNNASLILSGGVNYVGAANAMLALQRIGTVWYEIGRSPVLSGTQLAALIGAADTTLHFHAADRARANHTGTQALSTITGGTATGSGYTLPDLTVTGVLTNNVNVVPKTTTATLVASDQYVRADATSAAFTLNLPTAVGNTGLAFTIKKIDSSANAVTVGTTSSQTIDGATTQSLAAQYNSLTVISNGANWDLV